MTQEELEEANISRTQALGQDFEERFK